MEVGIFEGRNRFSELIEAAERGEEVVVLRRGKPVVRIVAADRSENLGARRAAALTELKSLRRQTVNEFGRAFTHAELIEARDSGKR
jgi:prevent-host-death family protein